jgi:hypothetical protein
MSRIVRTLGAIAILGLCTGSAKADLFELADGSKLDGKVLKEDGGFLTIKTLTGTQKLAAADLKSRTPGEADVDRYEKLKAASEQEGQSKSAQVAALLERYQFQKDHLAQFPPEADMAKENQRLLARILKKDPENVFARGEMGDVQWNGQWVKAADLPRLKQEAENEKRRIDWQTRFGVPITMVESEHFTLLDNTGDKDLAGRDKLLEKTYDTVKTALGVDQLWKDKALIVTIKALDPYCKVLDGFAAEMNINPTIVAAGKDRGTGGIWRQTPYAFQIRWPATGVESMWSAIVHNCAHVAVWTLWKSGGKAWEKENPPAWIDEGMGAWTEIAVMGQQISYCMGESAKQPPDKPGGTTDKGPKKKKDPKKNAEAMRESVSQYKEKCKDAITSDEFPQLRKFLKYKVGDLGPPEEGGVLALVTWLMQIDAAKFKNLFALLSKGGKKVDDDYWREAYGFQVIEDMETKWRAWTVGEW